VFEEGGQLVGDLLRAVLDEEVAGLKPVSGHVARPRPPDLEHVPVEPRCVCG
jgi:hypothetical protein